MKQEIIYQARDKTLDIILALPKYRYHAKSLIGRSLYYAAAPYIPEQDNRVLGLTDHTLILHLGSFPDFNREVHLCSRFFGIDRESSPRGTVGVLGRKREKLEETAEALIQLGFDVPVHKQFTYRDIGYTLGPYPQILKETLKSLREFLLFSDVSQLRKFFIREPLGGYTDGFSFTVTEDLTEGGLYIVGDAFDYNFQNTQLAEEYQATVQKLQESKILKPRWHIKNAFERMIFVRKDKSGKEYDIKIGDLDHVVLISKT